MLHLRQSTASQAVLIGPFVDTDGAAVTGLTIDAADIRLSKNGANIVGKNSGGGTHDELGMYSITLDATDTDTVGRLQLTVAESGALIVYHEFQVLEEAVFDALYAASALGYVANAPVNVAQFGGSNGTFASGIPAVNSTQISGDSTAADNLENAFDNTAGAVRWFGISDQGLVQSGSGTAVVIRAGASFAADELIGSTFAVVAGTGLGQKSLISDNDGSDGLTLETSLVTALDGTSFYQIYPTATSTAVSPPTAAAIADAVWDEATTGHTTSGTFGEQLKTDVDAILVDTGTTLDGKLDTIDNFLDTEIASIVTTVGAIETDTQDIQSRIPAALNNGAIIADVQRINDVEVVGAGTSGDKWRA
jgi:hypothetical protein